MRNHASEFFSGVFFHFYLLKITGYKSIYQMEEKFNNYSVCKCILQKL